MDQSTVQELHAIYPNWNTNGITWENFGTATQELLNNLMTDEWNLSLIAKLNVQNIWLRHPHRLGM
jgi:hypothetical protein